MNIFVGMKILWIFSGGHHKTGLTLGVISMHLGSFLKVNLQNGDNFWAVKIPDIFWRQTVDVGSKPTYDEKNESSPLLPHTPLGDIPPSWTVSPSVMAPYLSI